MKHIEQGPDVSKMFLLLLLSSRLWKSFLSASLLEPKRYQSCPRSSLVSHHKKGSLSCCQNDLQHGVSQGCKKRAHEHFYSCAFHEAAENQATKINIHPKISH